MLQPDLIDMKEMRVYVHTTYNDTQRLKIHELTQEILELKSALIAKLLNRRLNHNKAEEANEERA